MAILMFVIFADIYSEKFLLMHGFADQLFCYGKKDQCL